MIHLDKNSKLININQMYRKFNSGKLLIIVDPRFSLQNNLIISLLQCLYQFNIEQNESQY